MKKTTTRKLALTGLYAAVAAVLMFFEFPLPLLPPFLKLDLSDVAVLVGALTLGPLPGVAAALIKDLIHLSVTATGGVGELADFLISALFCAAAALINRRSSRVSRLIPSCAAGAAVMTAAAVVLNKVLLLPFYAQMMPLDAIFSLCAKANPLIVSVDTYLLYGVVPFNLIKGALISAVAVPVVRRLGKFLGS